MRVAGKKTVFLLICLLLITLLSGCGGFPTNWKKKYQALDVEHQNTLGLLDRERSDKGQLTDDLTQGQQTIAELQRKIEELKQSPAQATHFGEGYDVTFDASRGTITVTLPNAILFSPGKASLKKSTSAELDHIRSVLQQEYAGRQIDVVGHTDSDPIKKSKWKDNWELSAQRALTVLRYLVSRGIPDENIREIGCGESLPIASNATASGKGRNRRVEIVVHMR